MKILSVHYGMQLGKGAALYDVVVFQLALYEPAPHHLGKFWWWDEDRSRWDRVQASWSGPGDNTTAAGYLFCIQICQFPDQAEINRIILDIELTGTPIGSEETPETLEASP